MVSLSVRIRTEDASGFLKDRATSLVEGLRSVTKAGWYLETDDTDGPVLIIDRATIEGSPDYGRGSLWVRPSLASCGPFVTLGTLGTPGRTPPCPA